ncbi:hypothetical protein WJX77_009223 [Trebouxia sp. C0004]
MNEERQRSGSSASTTALSHQLSLSALPDELARRLDLVDQVKVSELVEGLQLVPAGFFIEVRHDIQGDDEDKSTQSQGIVSKWRQKERLKTTAVALVLCLNIGVDPPDVIKISPCARLECWVDPLSMQPPKALDTIGKNLQAQYERWQPRAKYKMHLDPTMDDVKKLAVSSRRAAKNERVLFHYNGHGVPRPTVNGEIWVFNKSYTQYIPMSIYDLQAWLGTPCIFVFDCSAAGLIVNSFKAFAEQKTQESENGGPPRSGGSGYAGGPHNGSPEDGLSDCILLAACGANELLPQSPHVPADVFTACLTTPIKVALRWFCSRSLMRQEGLTKELIDRIPGKQTDRKTPLGELNWIFTAITDTIAWNMLPRSLFQRLFRQDLLVASLFRNFLLAERIMRASACCPISYPRLPPTHHHPMWQAWDMAAEMCLLQLPDMLESEVEVEFQPSPFFNEQLTAFELWLEHGSDEKKPPEQLPIVLQVLLSQVHRLRALVLLGRFLDMGRWAVDLALSVGIFPYVLKLLQTTAPDLRQTLVFIWTKILALDKTCQVDLVKDSGQQYFIHYLDSNDSTSSTDSRAQAAFVLAVICDGHPRGQSLAAGAGLLGVCLTHLRHSMAGLSGGASGALLLIKWLCLCLGKLCQDMPEVTTMALRERVPEQLAGLLTASHPELRAAAVFTLGALVQVSDNESGPLSGMSEQDRLAAERAIACQLLPVTYDGSPLVRAELAAALARLATGHVVLFKDAVHEQQRNAAQILRGASPGSGPEAGPGSAPGSTGPRSAPSAGGPSSVPAMERASSSLDEASKSEGNGHVDTGVSSPGVQTSATGTFSPLLSVSIAVADGSIHSPLDAGSYASADAARVGGGLYKHLLQAACTLATDPAPKVARLGKAALRVADVELAPVSIAAGQLPSANSASVPSRMHSMVSNSSFLGLPSSLSMSRASSHALPPSTSTHPSQPQPSASKWRSLAWRTSSRSLAGSVSVCSSPASPSLPNLPPDALTRKPFVLRMVNGENMGRAPSIDAAQPSSRTPSITRMHSLHSSTSGPTTAASSSQLQQHDEDSAGSSLHGPIHTADTPLPPSPVYKDSCEHFSWPLLEPQASLWRAEATHQGWLGGCVPPDPTKMASRMREKEQSTQRCAQLGSGARLKDNVHTIDSEAGSTVALLLHPFRPLVTLVDGGGSVRVHNYRHSTVINRFHVTGEAAAERKGQGKVVASVTFLHQLNEVQDGLLLAGTADGALRVWRNYAHKAEQRLATAWQAVPVAQAHSSQYHPQQAVFALNEASGRLYAAGGATPSTVHTWDMSQECCTQQTHVSGSDDDDTSRDGGGVQHLAVARQEPLMLAGCFNGLVQLYDLRQSQKAAASVQPHRTPMLGMVLEPGGLSNQLVTGTSWGELKFIDFRMVDSTGQTGVWKTVEAHSKGAMSAMTAHPYSPLLATATETQVLKLWSPRGEQQGVIRATAPFLAQRVGPVNCLEFHPYRLLLASGGGDPIIALYPIVSASAEHTAAPAASTDSPGCLLNTDSSRPSSAS